MKKVLLTIALVAFAITANAQYVLGGSVGFNHTGGSITYHGDGPAHPDWHYPGPNNNVKTSSFTFAPKLGYQLNDKMQIGLQIGFISYSETDYNPSGSNFDIYYATIDGFEGWEKNSYKEFYIAPYFRYNIAKFGKFTFFCEGEARLGFYPRAKSHFYNTSVVDGLGNEVLAPVDNEVIYDGKAKDLLISIVPGLNYSLTSNISFDLYIDLFGISYYRSKGISYNWYAVDDQDYMEYIDSYFGLNATLSSQTIRDHLTNFRLSFNYHF